MGKSLAAVQLFCNGPGLLPGAFGPENAGTENAVKLDYISYS
jgi:hypothetical protein